MTDTRIAVWKQKMCRGVLDPPKLCSLPPTSAAFMENVLRAHLQVAIWYSATLGDPPSLNPLDYGWSQKHPASDLLVPTLVPPGTVLALVKVIKCNCNSSHCSSKRCSVSIRGETLAKTNYYRKLLVDHVNI